MVMRHGHETILAGVLLVSVAVTACADEGMWVFNNLPLGTLKAHHQDSSRSRGGPSTCDRRRCDSTMADQGRSSRRMG